MKKRLLLIVILVSILAVHAFAKTFTFPLTLNNLSNQKLSVSYQTGFMLNSDSGNNIYLGELAAGETKTFEGVSVEKTLNLYVLINFNGTMVLSNSYQVKSKPNRLSFQLNIPAQKDSKSPAATPDQLEQQLSRFGASDIALGDRMRMKVNLPLSNGLATICRSLIIIDPKVTDKTGEFKYSDIANYIQSYKLNAVPASIVPKGNTLKDIFEYENSASITTTFSFPLAGSINLGMSNANYYKTAIEVKDVGWIDFTGVDSKSYATRLAELPTHEDRLAISLNIKAAMDACKGCKIYPVESAYFYESLSVTTSKYEKLSGVVDASVSSVVSTNGAYKRSEQTDFSYSSGSTISYVALGGEVTAEVMNMVSKILELESLKVIAGRGTPKSEIESRITEKTPAAVPGPEMTIIPTTPKEEIKPATEYVDKAFVDQAKKLTTKELEVKTGELQKTIQKGVE